MGRWWAIGTLAGLGLGVVLYLVFPKLLQVDFTFNINERQAMELPVDMVSPFGGIYAVGATALLLGMLGGLGGMLIYKIKQKLVRK